MRSALSRPAVAALALAAALALSGSPASAASLDSARLGFAQGGRGTLLVSSDWDDRRYRRHRHSYRGYYGDTVVDAPFTHVETGYRGRVAVDAPFASVRVGRRGTWVRAPFVDIFVPRW
jgi:hypothetical protein